MDIVTLPVGPRGRPANASTRSAQQPQVADAVERAPKAGSAPPSTGTFERVVQGELLERHAARYQSTRAFLVERSMEHSQPADRQAASDGQARPAIRSYLQHTRPQSVAELTQGRSVDLLV